MVVSRAGVALAHDSAVSSGTLASKELLRRLDFRGIAAPVAPSLRRLTVRHSSPADGPGHTAVRKFIKNFLPVILYAHPRVEARVERAAGAAPGVEATHADGRVEWHDAAAVAAACERRGDRELFRLLTDTEPPESGGVREAPRKRKRRPAAAAGAPAGAAPTAGDAEA